jgi:phage shock protein A
MGFWKRFTSGLNGQLDAVVARFENHDSLVKSAIVELRENIAGAEVRLDNVRRDGVALEQRLQEQTRAEAQWKERARRTLDDEERALECLRRGKRAARAVEELQARLQEHRRVEAGLAKDVRTLREGLRDLEEQRNLMRARQTRADALGAMRDNQGQLSGEVREILDRWEIQIKQSEFCGNCASVSSDDLEERFDAEEERQALCAELEQMRGSHE